MATGTVVVALAVANVVMVVLGRKRRGVRTIVAANPAATVWRTRRQILDVMFSGLLAPIRLSRACQPPESQQLNCRSRYARQKTCAHFYPYQFA
jgi:hypothetical protein